MIITSVCLCHLTRPLEEILISETELKYIPSVLFGQTHNSYDNDRKCGCELISLNCIKILYLVTSFYYLNFMTTTENYSESVSKYISGFPEETQKLLKQLRQTIKTAAPEAEEVISYSMPGYKKNGMLVWFAGYSGHIGFYPGASGIEAFKNELSIYKGAKGSVQFPLTKPLPLDLIGDIVKFRVSENLEKVTAKKKNRRLGTSLV